ncbi:MAG: type II toxin-antitoxin system VapB family antitoxin [Spirochaetaceae bacterium]
MPLNIKNDKAHELARELAELSQTSITEAVTMALREAVEVRRSRTGRLRETRVDGLISIAENTQRLPVLDNRSAEEILGYDERGVPS